MKYNEAIARITPDIYHNMRQSLEKGKWPDGRVVSAEQKENCLQAIIAYEEIHNIPEEQRLGYIDRGDKTDPSRDNDSETLTWKH